MDLASCQYYKIYNISEMNSMIKTIIADINDCTYLDEASAFNVRLILSELITNGFKHGGACRERPFEVWLDARKGNLLRFVVDDGGPGFRREPKVCANVLAESGRGLTLVNELVESIDYQENSGKIYFCVGV